MTAISVIVPTHNRAEQVRVCVRALLRQSLARSAYEIIVVVDGSTDHTAAVLAEFSSQAGFRVIWQECQGPGGARNRGAAAATGATCLFLDDDVVADPDLLAAHARAQQQGGGVLGLGRVETVPRHARDGFAACVARWLRASHTQIEQGLRSPSFLDCHSGNVSVPREAFLAAGGFSADLLRYEDIELGYRLIARGVPVVYLEHARGREDFLKRFRLIARDAERSGAASVELYRRHPPMLPVLQLGKFAAAGARVLLARRLLLRLRVPTALLALLDRLLGGPGAERWYSFVYDYCYWRGVQGAVQDPDTWRRLTQGVLILSYHAFGAASEPPGRFVVPARRFARQMRWLRLAGYRVVSLRALLEERRDNQLTAPASVAITLDDGYADNVALAYPILRRSRLLATLFLVSGAVGGTNDWDADGELARRPLLTWSTLRRIGQEGLMEYGAHTRSHVQLPSLPPLEARAEMERGRAELEEQLGGPISVFAYPYGARDPAIDRLAEDVGFLGACGVEPGPNTPATPRYALRRTAVHGTDSLLRFALTLWLGELPRPGESPPKLS